MENADVIVILFLAATIGIVSVSIAAITATYKSMPPWAQSLLSSGAEFVIGEVNDVTEATENDIDDALLDALIERLEAAGVITRMQTVDAELFSNHWLDDPKPSDDESKPDDASKPAA